MRANDRVESREEGEPALRITPGSFGLGMLVGAAATLLAVQATQRPLEPIAPQASNEALPVQNPPAELHDDETEADETETVVPETPVAEVPATRDPAPSAPAARSSSGTGQTPEPRPPVASPPPEPDASAAEPVASPPPPAATAEDRPTASALPPLSACSDVLFYDGFESGDMRGATGGMWEGTSNPWGSAGFTQDTVLHGNWARRGTFLATPQGRDADVTFWASWPDNARQEVWIEWYLRVPENYRHRDQSSQQSRGTNNKFMTVGYSRETLHGGWQQAGWHTRLEVDLDRSSNGVVSRSQPYVGWQGESFSLRQPFGSPWSFEVIGPSDLGTWMKVGAHVRLGSSIQAADAIVEYWINDKLVVGSQSLKMSVRASDAPPPPIASMELLGWANSGFTDTTNFYLDEVLVCGDPLPWDTVRRGHTR